MGARSKKLKTMNRGETFSDGKVSVRNYFDKQIIDIFTTHYEMAIQSNYSSVKNICKSTWIIYCHYRFTDQPMHHFSQLVQV